MGKLIICNGKQALKPYIIKLTNTKIYSIEELCYYIYNNIDTINHEFFGEALIDWISEELQLTERADKLQTLLGNKAGIKDIIVSILCCADYYSEIEIKQLLRIIDELAVMTPIEKMKRKADTYLKYRQYSQAATEYEAILNGKDAVNLTSEEYGNLLHNLAVVQLNLTGMSIAADKFQEAYERNHNQESLKLYLYALKLSKQEDIFKNAVINYHVSVELQEQIDKEIELKFMEAENVEIYQKVYELQNYKQLGKFNQFYQTAGELISQWKQEFRRENM